MSTSTHTADTRLGTHRLDAIVIGGSAGVLEVLRVLLAGLPQAIGIAVVIVVHLPEHVPGMLHQVLSMASPLPMRQAQDKEPLAPGTIYFAPPGYHLLVEADGHFALSVDEPVHYSRPAIDVLFESASDAFGARLLGILLTGASQDGAAGLKAIHDAGGVTLVQAPDSAEAPMMPAAALALFTPTFVGPPAQLRDRLASLEVRAVAG